ncbi:hypothetical protein BGZ83_004726 [Gryganskiella cystojenkinii]|nr:hypothetical protein BGZ83_004726 [Gryganskiella cystojenkinii]
MTFTRGLLDQLDQSQRQRSDFERAQDGTLSLRATRRTVLKRHPFGNLKELTFHGYGINHDQYLKPLLPALSHLQKLKLELWDRQSVFLLRLLRACPVLEDLTVTGRRDEGLQMWIHEDDQEERSSTVLPLNTHPLKRLYLHHISLRPRSIERLVILLKDLVSLRILDFNRPWIQDTGDFFCPTLDMNRIRELIKTHLFPPKRCPLIEALQLEPYDPNAVFAYYTFTRSTYGRNFPGIRTVHSTTVFFQDHWCAYSLDSDEHVLEITGHGRHYQEGRVILSPGLGGYLRRNRDLIHLRATDSVIQASDLVDVYESDSFKTAMQVRDKALAIRQAEETARALADKTEATRLAADAAYATTGFSSDTVTHISTGTKSRHKKKSTAPALDVPVRPAIQGPIQLDHSSAWVCQGLLTLKLGFITKLPFSTHDASTNPRTTERKVLTANDQIARAYAFIATVCPNLRIVEFFHPVMVFGQQHPGGMESRTGGEGGRREGDGTKGQEIDLHHPLKQLSSLRNLETLTLRLTTVVGHIDYSDFEWMTTATTVLDSNGQGMGEENHGKVSPPHCWPRLESFQIRYRDSAKNEDYQYWMALMRELRPGLDVRVKQDLLIPSYESR